MDTGPTALGENSVPETEWGIVTGEDRDTEEGSDRWREHMVLANMWCGVRSEHGKMLGTRILKESLSQPKADDDG